MRFYPENIGLFPFVVLTALGLGEGLFASPLPIEGGEPREAVSFAKTSASDSQGVVVLIALPELVKVNQTQVILGDVASLSEGNRKTLKRLEKVSLGEAPARQRAKTLSQSGLRSWLIQQGFAPESFKIEGAKTCRIELETVSITGDELRMRGRKYLDHHYAQSEGRARLTGSGPVRDVAIPAGVEAPTISIHPISALQGTRLVRLEAHIIADGLVLERVPMSFEVQQMAKVWVARKRIRAGVGLYDGIAEVREVDLSKVRGTPLSMVSSLDSYRTKRALREGEVLTQELVERPPLVERSERVTVMIRRGRLMVRVDGIARHSGVEGDVIPVMNLRSKRVLSGVIVGPGLVEVGS